MATNREKVVYNITLQSEEDDEVKVIDRFNLSRVKSLLIAQHFFLVSFQLQHGGDVSKAENLLRIVVVLR